MKYLILSTLLLFASCVTAPAQKLNPEVYYKQDICVTYVRDVDKHGEVGTWYRNKVKRKFRLFHKGKTYQEIYMCGTGVLPKDDSYDLTINHTDKITMFIGNTCHREMSAENPDSGIFKKDGQYKIDYQPTLEKDRACPLYLAAYNSQSRNGWGTIAFESDKYQLPAKVECNGDAIDFKGTSICQSRFGSIQRITFPEEVIEAKPVNGPAQRHDDCPVLPTKDHKTYEFLMPKRECYYGFIGKQSGKAHKFYTIGYEEIIVREM